MVISLNSLCTITFQGHEGLRFVGLDFTQDIDQVKVRPIKKVFHNVLNLSKMSFCPPLFD